MDQRLHNTVWIRYLYGRAPAQYNMNQRSPWISTCTIQYESEISMGEHLHNTIWIRDL